MPKFRLHTTDGEKHDVPGDTAEAVRKAFEKDNPDVRITKIKLVK
jgi:hypothetical protein